tara:strand:+ start:28351 stop:28539 length:189 start_codon:yes stop_codon:yes gene_type:complete
MKHRTFIQKVLYFFRRRIKMDKKKLSNEEQLTVLALLEEGWSSAEIEIHIQANNGVALENIE